MPWSTLLWGFYNLKTNPNINCLMKKILLLILILNCQLSIVNLANAQFESAPAFPGAEGFARLTTTGGRGGKVLHVTSLADDGSEGTFR